MKQQELVKRLKAVLADLADKANSCTLCNAGRGTKRGYEYAIYEIECAMDKRKRKDMAE